MNLRTMSRKLRGLTQFVICTLSLIPFLLAFPASVRAQVATGQSVPPPLGELIDIGGRRLHLHCAGKDQPTVIVENGSSGFSVEWVPVLAQVSRFARICTYDRAGFAWSDPGPAINTVEETMDDLHLLLRIASVAPPYILVGHSIGGMFVRAYQRRYPSEIVGMVLVDATPEDDLSYTIKGADKAETSITYDEMAAAFAPLIKNPPPPAAAPDKVEEPIDRLAPDLQKAWLWAIRKWFAEIDLSHSWVTAESWREEFIALKHLRIAGPHVLGDLPLVVLARGRRTDPLLNQREAELVSMSSRGAERIASESDHLIQLYQPDLVTQAIRDVKLIYENRRVQ